MKLDLYRMRDSWGFSLQYVAKQMGVSVRTVYYWESGKKLPSLEHLVKLAHKVYFCRVDDLLVLDYVPCYYSDVSN